MKLYHTTKKANQSLIEWNGGPQLAPGNQVDLNWSNADETFQGQDICGLFGFTDIEDAKEFGYENGGDFIIYAFDADGETLDDPEYDDPEYLNGEAKFFVTEEHVDAELVFEA